MRNCNRSVRVPLLVVLGFTLLLVILATPAATAQSEDDLARDAIAKTDRVIAHTRELLAALESDRGERAFVDAEDLQDDARAALDRGDLREAQHLTLQARERVLLAIGDTPQRPQGAERVENELLTTDRYLNNAKRATGPRGKGPPGGRRNGMRSKSPPGGRPNGMGPKGPPPGGGPQRWVIGGMEKRQEQAWEYYRRGELRYALRETLAVQERLKNLKTFRDGNGPRSRGDHFGRLELELKRIGSSLDRAEQMIGDSHPRVTDHLNIAKAAHQAARGALKDGNPRDAQRHLRASHESLIEVLKRVAETLSEDEFRRLQSDAHARWQAMTEDTAQDVTFQTRRHLKRASGSLDEAERAFYQGKKRTALLNLFKAMSMIDLALATSSH